MTAPLVLSPGQTADLLGVDPSTVRRWVRAGHCPNVFATLPGTRIGVPRWWVDQLTSPGPVVVAGGEDGPAAAVPHGTHGGGSHLRTVPEVAPSGAA